MSMRAGVLIAAAAALLAWLIAVPGPLWPPAPAQSEELAPAKMQAVFGTASADGDALSVTGADRDSALQVLPGLQIDASSLTVLRYRAEDFPSTLELVLVWRTAEEPQETRSATLPAPGRGTRAFDLSTLKHWRGTVVEVGLGQFPVPHQVPEGSGFEPFKIEALRLESPSLGNSLALFLDALSAPRPWSLRSINSLGRELGARGGGEPIPVLAIALAAFAGVLLALCWRDRRRVLAVVAGAAFALWLLLDLAWQSQLSAQNRLTRAARAEGPVADAALADAAAQVREWLAERRPRAKVLVIASAPYVGYRIVYHLIPADAALGGGLLAINRRPPAGTVLVVHDQVEPQIVDGELRYAGATLPNVILLTRKGPLQIVEYLGEEAAP